jgi:Cu(I)/Ag(I) efflux system periplasmic protein CusF
MRATTCALVGALTLAIAGAAAAQSDTKSMSSMKGMPGMAMAPAGAKHGQGTGVIKAIDPKDGALTIQHGPIPAASWPAMTMTFKAKPAELLKGLKVGQTVDFDTTVTGATADVTAVRPK